MAYNRKLLFRAYSAPNWSTADGNLGDLFQLGDPIENIQLNSSEIKEPGSAITYSLTSGNLPNGLTLSDSGEISGTVSGYATDEIVYFTIAATDDEGDITNRDFYFTIVNSLYVMDESITFTSNSIGGGTVPSLQDFKNGLSSPGSDAFKNNTSYFNSDGPKQLWVVPKTKNYRIEANGAGSSSNGGGFGARMSGDFFLQKGEVIQIVVGQTPSGNGGSGGTFVVRSPYNNNNSILVIAGGGGGSHGYGGPSNASVGTSGLSGTGGISGGANGNGGSAGAGSGGGGFFTNGAGGSCGSQTGGVAFINNGTSGSGSAIGGGGGVGCSHGGGGGGYSGGGGSSASPYSGGGGGSYNNGSNQENLSGINASTGSVVITML